MKQSEAYQLGVTLVTTNRGVTKSAYNVMQGKIEKLDSAEGDVFQRELCKIAAAAYEADDLKGSVPYQLFHKLASSDKWCEAYSTFTTPVMTALGKYANREIELQKEAGAVAALPFVADKVGIPSVVKMLLGLGAVGGAGAGSLGFLLSRDARQSSAENNAITEKTRAYKQLRRDIDEDLAATGALEQTGGGNQGRYNL